MIVRLSRAALVDVGALLLGGVGLALIRLGRWLSDDDDHLADLGDE